MEQNKRAEFFQRVWAMAKDGQQYLSPEMRSLIPRPYGKPLPAQVGFIGERYRGLVFCALNPAVPRRGDPEEDRRFRLLKDLAVTKDVSEASEVFEALMTQTRVCMAGEGVSPPWPGIYRNFVRKVLAGATLTLDNAAYIDVVPFPTEGNSVGLSKKMVHSCLNQHSLALLRALAPHTIVFRYKRSYEAWPASVLPKKTYVVGGMSASSTDIAAAVRMILTP